MSARLSVSELARQWHQFYSDVFGMDVRDEVAAALDVYIPKAGFPDILIVPGGITLADALKKCVQSFPVQDFLEVDDTFDRAKRKGPYAVGLTIPFVRPTTDPTRFADVNGVTLTERLLIQLHRHWLHRRPWKHSVLNACPGTGVRSRHPERLAIAWCQWEVNGDFDGLTVSSTDVKGMELGGYGVPRVHSSK